MFVIENSTTLFVNTNLGQNNVKYTREIHADSLHKDIFIVATNKRTGP
jgi:hypothetical protein